MNCTQFQCCIGRSILFFMFDMMIRIPHSFGAIDFNIASTKYSIGIIEQEAEEEEDEAKDGQNIYIYHYYNNIQIIKIS